MEDLKNTTTEILKLIQGASRFIIDYKSESEMGERFFFFFFFFFWGLTYDTTLIF
jgi:hypothetical protein